MNFNFSTNPEYELNTSLVEEMINLYGIKVKFLVAERVNKDDLVFGDHSHLKTDSTRVHYIYMLPESSDDWDTSNFGISGFGLVNYENITLFAAKSAFDPKPDDVDDLHEIAGNLIVLPNNKVMEITTCDATVPGINNLFTYNDAKSVYKLVCKPYDFKLINEVNNEDISLESGVPYESLDNYFDELIGVKDKQNKTAQEELVSVAVDKTTALNTKVNKPIVDKTERAVWGEFE